MTDHEKDFPDIVNMSSVSVDGARFQALRAERRLTQLKLAMMADVSERTVRAAENGSPIRLTSLEALAKAMAVRPSELVKNPGAIEDETRPQRNLQRLISALEKYTKDFDTRGLAEVITSETLITVKADPSAPFTGSYRGREGLWELRDRSASSFEFLSPLNLKEARVSQDLIALSGSDHICVLRTQRETELWWRHIWQMQGETVFSWEVLYDTYKTKLLFSEDP